MKREALAVIVFGSRAAGLAEGRAVPPTALLDREWARGKGPRHMFEVAGFTNHFAGAMSDWLAMRWPINQAAID